MFELKTIFTKFQKYGFCWSENEIGGGTFFLVETWGSYCASTVKTRKKHGFNSFGKLTKLKKYECDIWQAKNHGCNSYGYCAKSPGACPVPDLSNEKSREITKFQAIVWLKNKIVLYHIWGTVDLNELPHHLPNSPESERRSLNRRRNPELSDPIITVSDHSNSESSNCSFESTPERLSLKRVVIPYSNVCITPERIPSLKIIYQSSQSIVYRCKDRNWQYEM